VKLSVSPQAEDNFAMDADRRLAAAVARLAASPKADPTRVSAADDETRKNLSPASLLFEAWN
jgi:hypothetical protein